jgi:hypothetical protein
MLHAAKINTGIPGLEQGDKKEKERAERNGGKILTEDYYRNEVDYSVSSVDFWSKMG